MAPRALPGLSFSSDLVISGDAARILRLPVTSSNTSFALVVAFGRCRYRLDCISVGTILQATIGGLADLFRVSQLVDRTFKFFVHSKPVGFFVANLLSFNCDQYFLTFHLWGNGGHSW